MTDASPRLFVFGLGYSALALARRLLAEGWRVAGSCRQEAKAAALAAEGIETFRFDGTRPLAEPERALAGTTHLLASAPPDGAGDPALRHHAADIAALPALRWIGYLSTTGVYGDHGGGWVDETTAVEPSSERGARRAEAERAWLALGRPQEPGEGPAVQLFRLAGIYGPGRNQLEGLLAGTAKRVVKPGQVFSRIHVEDIATVLQAAIAQPSPGAIYNLCDDEPADPAEVVAFAAGLLGRAPPPAVAFEQAELSPMARSFYADSKRVSNRRIKQQLGVTLAYPTYREGLRALLATLRR